MTPSSSRPRAGPRRCTLAALFLALASAPGCVEPYESPGAGVELEPDVRAEILWDRYGVPHIYARDLTSLFHAFGWAQARNHGDLILRLYGQARGRAAEYWGADHVEDDRWIHTVRLPEQAEEAYRAQPAELRGYLDAFAEGINAYAEAHPERIDPVRAVVLPVEGRDVAARSVGIELLFSPARARAERWRQLPGSNAWAVGPERSATGNALLWANPHLPWEGPFLFFEAQLTAPGLDAYGAALVGTPVLGIAFNDHLGWTHTVNTQIGENLYQLELVEGGYRFDGASRAFDVDTAWIRILPDDGTAPLDSLPLERRRSVHGPVIGNDDARALALRRPQEAWDHFVLRHLDMMRARSLAEFEDALRPANVAGFNVVYADREGNILYHYGGVTPRRGEGNYGFWSGIVPGDTSAHLWTDVHGYDEMPRVLNPGTGWVQNANDPPWFATFPPVLDPDDHPAYLAPRGLAARPRQSIRLLLDSGPLTLEEMIRRAKSTDVELADRLVPELLRAVEGGNGSDDVARAAGILEEWDRTIEADSRGGVLFEAWFEEAMRRTGGRLVSTPWSADDPLGTPRGLADPEAAVAALDVAARAVTGRWGSADVAWGEVHRLRRDGVDVAASGGPGALGLFRVLHFREAGDGLRTPTHGDSYVAAVEFSDPVRARALTVYGNASQPGSPHRSDQLEYHAGKELRPVWRTRGEIEDHLIERETFPVPSPVGGG